MKLHPKTPLPLVFGTLVNIVLIVLFEILLLYRAPLPPTEQLLAKADHRYEGCRVISNVNMDESRGVRFYLVKTAEGETDLVPLKQHSFFPSRTRLSSRKILQNLDLETESTTQVPFGIEIYTVFISDGAVRVMFSAGGSFQQTALTKYLVLGFVLTILDLAVWEKLRGTI